MRKKLLALPAGLFLLIASGGPARGGEEIFSDSFAHPPLSREWRVESGNWAAEDGSLSVDSGRGWRLVELDILPGIQFEMELELDYAGQAIIYFDRDRSSCFYILSYHHSSRGEQEGVFYLSERDSRTNESLVYRHLRRDTDFGGGVPHRVRVVYDSGEIKIFFNENLKESALFRFNPDPRLAFGHRELREGDYLRIKNFRIRKKDDEGAAVKEIDGRALSGAVLYRAGSYDVVPAPEERIRVSEDAALLAYEFDEGPGFEAVFARIPAEAGPSGRVRFEAEGDNSNNLLFVTLIDAGGEHHVAAEIPLRWEGRREISVVLSPFLTLSKERTRKHWGGNENQLIDFPVRSIDIGVAKRSAREKHSGKIVFGNVRFSE